MRARLSLIDEASERYLRTAHLASAGGQASRSPLHDGRNIWRVQPAKIALLSEDEVTSDLLQ